MSKKNKGNIGRPIGNNQKAADQSAKPSSIFEKMSKAAGVSPMQPPELEEILPKLQGELTDDLRKELEATAQRQLEARVAELNADKEALEAEKKAFETRANSLEVQEAALEERSSACAALEAELKRRNETLTTRDAAQTARERELEERELEARNGFHLQNQKALQGLREQVEALERRRSALDLEIATELTQARDRQKQEFESWREQLKAREEALSERELDLATQREELEARERQLHLSGRNRDQMTAMLRKQLEEEFAADITSRERENQRLKAKLVERGEKLDRVQAELDEYADFTEMLRGRAPSDLLNELDELRHDNRELKRQQMDLEARNAADETDDLREELERSQEEVRQLRADLEAMKQRAHNSKLVVLERERWAQEKLLLEQAKQLLSAQINDLESRVGALIDSQQAAVAFPELAKMDQEHGFQTPRPVDQIEDLKVFTDELQHRIALTQPDNPLYFHSEDLQLFVGGLAMSQLHVFQGISGTGKTSLAKAFAKAVGGECQDIAVQAGWRDRSDLLGHYNAFEKRFAEKECLQAMYRAGTPFARDRLNIVLLDEMNLSRPEQYFADFLSALEKEPDDRWIRLVESRPPNAPGMFREGREVRLPQNLWFIGTANQDETTNELADKTHDRAFVLELPRHEDRFAPNRKLNPKTYSFSSLNDAFTNAQRTWKKDVEELLGFVSQSELSSLLEKKFGIGWGNRFERQAGRFLPVVKSSGGTFVQGLDHLLSTRLFRNGKVIGRYDINRNDLDDVEKALLSVFRSIEVKASPDRCLAAIRRDIQRLERGA
ncbi:MAG: AAA family ATPase [Zoogloea sp.]|nr:AAA family ATPase [Zoogloea sp.]